MQPNPDTDPRSRRILSGRNDWKTERHNERSSSDWNLKLGFISAMMSNTAAEGEAEILTRTCCKSSGVLEVRDLVSSDLYSVYIYQWIDIYSVTLQCATFAHKQMEEAKFTSSSCMHLSLDNLLKATVSAERQGSLGQWTAHQGHWYLCCPLTSQDLLISLWLSPQVRTGGQVVFYGNNRTTTITLKDGSALLYFVFSSYC